MSDLISRFKKIVGDAHVLTNPADTENYFREYSGRYQGQGLAVLRPASTQEVSDLVKLCAANNIAIVPQGGNTCLVGGSVPYQANAVVINLGRMNKIRDINPQNFSMTVDAGCLLQHLQGVAKEHDRYLPLQLGAQGSCMIGGNIAANAGGILTLRYGNTRDLVLGLEVVLPNGEIWDGLRSLRKDNMGYNLKHLFIGCEGTLGIITGAVLKLTADPGHSETFFAAAKWLEDIVTIFSEIRGMFGENVQAYEVMSQDCVDVVLRYAPKCSAPLEGKSPWYLLVEVTGSADHLRAQVEDFLAAMFEKNLLQDATIAQNEAQRKQFWLLREEASPGARYYPGGSIKHDVSVPIAAMPDFVREANDAVAKLVPQPKMAIFGHAGDGNLHYDLCQDAGWSQEKFLGMWDEISHVVHDIGLKYGGSMAAEHGVGVFKVEELEQRKSPVEMELMHKIKQALDPQNIMNPGKVLK